MCSDSEVAKTLQLMNRAASTKLTPEVARELCQRAGSKAYLAGSIASLGSEYVLGLKAANCRSGDPLAEEQVTAASKEKVLDALSEAASKLRSELGESLATVQKFDVPLAEATTSSLEALKAFSQGEKAYSEKSSATALPYHQRAIQLDPNFAMAYGAVGNDYFGLGELGRASKYYTKAFELREHASEREKLREALEMTQARLARTLGVNQAAVSKPGHRTDMYVSTLQDVIKAMGGELKITAKFSTRTVEINQFDLRRRREQEPNIRGRWLKPCLPRRRRALCLFSAEIPFPEGFRYVTDVNENGAPTTTASRVHREKPGPHRRTERSCARRDRGSGCRRDP
jgi:tetratricopeptide (TPR) repeat protein